jgi:sialate O-acetylesterase
MIKLPALFGDGMILQQGAEIPLSGKASPRVHIVLRFAGFRSETDADENGNWSLSLKPAGEGGPYTIEIEAGNEFLSIKDIFAGDVWICSGQSNMELPMERLKDDFPEEWESPNQLIRQFKVPQEWDFIAPREDFASGQWRAASAETLAGFSGTAYFFAKDMFEKRKTPIGLINAALGGSPIEAWMSRDALAEFPRKFAEYEKFADPADREEREKKIQGSAEAVRLWEEKARSRDVGLIEKWFSPEIDDTDWLAITLPSDFSENDLPDFCGVLWLRKSIEIPAEFVGKRAKVWLGTIMDADTVYLNGVQIGSTGYRYPPRKYIIPENLLHKGKNEIVIRVVCNNGQGGITRDKPFHIFPFDNGKEKEKIRLSGGWKRKIGVRLEPRPRDFFIQWKPVGLFNAMIAPLLTYPARGVIWYQGESNTDAPEEYGAMFAALIRDWRNSFHSGELPFLFVQLPIFGVPEENTLSLEKSRWAVLREEQAKALSLPLTGMATALDLGEWNDLHPINKKDVGRRLALAARKLLYNEENSSPGILLKRIERKGNTLILTFDNCGGSLISKGDPYFTIISKEKKTRIPAFIKGENRLEIDISGIDSPETLLYAWADNPLDRQIYNSESLPAIPFRVKIENSDI